MSKLPSKILDSEAEKIEKTIADNEQRFLLNFLFEVTCVGRQFRENPDELAQLNEINHRVLNRLLDLSTEEQWSYFEYVPDLVMAHVSRAPRLERPIKAALMRAYGRISRPM